MTDITTYDQMNLAKLFESLLINGGITTAVESVNPLFKIGCAYDTESSTLQHKEIDHYKKDKTPVYHTVVDTCFCYSYQFAIGEYYAIYRRREAFLMCLTTLVDTVKKLTARPEFENAVLCIWCANMAHEWAFIKGDLMGRYNITKLFAKTARDAMLIQIEKCVEFRECLGLFGRSLADISKHWCEKFGKLVGGLDYDLVRTSETDLTETDRDYMRNDVLSLTEMHTNVIAYYTQKNGCCKLPYTSSGFVRMALKNAIRNDERLTEERENFNFYRREPVETNIEYLKIKNRRSVVSAYQWDICRNYSYSGGLCGSNIAYVGKILNNVICADITSDYPAQMVQKQFPTGRLTRVNPSKYDAVKAAKKPFFALLKIKRMTSKSRHATFSKHKIINGDKTSPFAEIYGTPEKLIIYNGKVLEGENMIVCWNDIDIAAYNEIYEINGGCLDLWVFDRYARAPQWLTDTMCNDYVNKALLKAAGKQNTQDYNEAKRNVNTYYGVLATRDHDVNDAVDGKLNFTNSKTKSFEKKARDFWLNPYIAFWVTSYARTILMHFISRFPDAIVQYDTDSLYYLRSKGKDLEKALNEYNAEILSINRRRFRNHPNREIFDTLGQWDFDEVYKKFLPMGAKKYIKQDDAGIHTVIAGLPKKAIPAEIQARGISQPLTYYNPLVRYINGLSPVVIIQHMFAHKFASVYNDDITTRYETITDYNGKTALQAVSSYHAITPIDFTLSIGVDFLKHALHVQ